jgi:hypothetical protein
MQYCFGWFPDDDGLWVETCSNILCNINMCILLVECCELVFCYSIRQTLYGRTLAGIAGSNPAGGMDVCFL